MPQKTKISVISDNNMAIILPALQSGCLLLSFWGGYSHIVR